MSMVREFRSLKARELRAEQGEDGKRYLSGYAATYNTLSDDLGWGMRERIMPGAFARAVNEGQDVRHLINHDPNLVLGRTKAKTTELVDDSKGLHFRTLMPDTGYARDLFESVGRGDIDECSFGFIAVRTAWIEEPDPEDEKRIRCIRELHDVDLFDISTVTYPAYPGTNTTAERSRMFPDGVPVEVRSRMKRDAADGDESCGCSCAACIDGDCAECSNADCEEVNCRDCPMQAAERAKRAKKTRRVDGEDLAADCFLVVGDPEDTRTWKLPSKFSTDEKTRTHLKNNLVRFNELKSVSDEGKTAAWGALVKLCKDHQIDPSNEAENLRSFLTSEQLYDFQRDSIVAAAEYKLRAIKASL